MENKIRQYIRECINNLFEITAAELKDQKDNLDVQITRDDKNIGMAKKEKTVASADKINVQKTKGNIKDIDPQVEKTKTLLATKEFEKYKKQEKEKGDLLKDLELDKTDDLKKKSELDKLKASEEKAETTVADNQPSTPDAPSSAGQVASAADTL